ncbi:hypothetical protein EVAR_24887_1 [Eumeta japonica]|uniref:Uncharacterized protein n=1 Tax=Eumeta variegata TaxID=151549 RepID=A0A4C1V565_EUMVA|nr:hypothetical protein EVAR_24887_1 [Eumeta japonica]
MRVRNELDSDERLTLASLELWKKEKNQLPPYQLSRRGGIEFAVTSTYLAALQYDSLEELPRPPAQPPS